MGYYSSSNEEMIKISSDADLGFMKAADLPSGLALMMVLRASNELGLFEIIAKSGEGSKLSAKQIADFLPQKNPNSHIMIDRMFKFLASQSILKCTLSNDDENGGVKYLYSLTPISKHFVPNYEDGVSISPIFQFLSDKVLVDSWYGLKGAVLEGGIPFSRTHGMNAFEYAGKDDRFNEVFNKAMQDHSKISVKRLLQCYKGFELANVVVDVGGGVGSTLACIVSEYPNIKGINFDLPHVIERAPSHPGVEHIAGDMFDSVPSADIIFMKFILHDWDDEHCLKLLENCSKALPENGKVVFVERVMPENPEDDAFSGENAFTGDMFMMAMFPGGKERTAREFEALAKQAGFASLKVICPVYNDWVIELYKS